jgi:hypothetical protein
MGCAGLAPRFDFCNQRAISRDTAVINALNARSGTGCARVRISPYAPSVLICIDHASICGDHVAIP